MILVAPPIHRSPCTLDMGLAVKAFVLATSSAP